VSNAAARLLPLTVYGPADAPALCARFEGVATERMLETVLGDPRFGRLAVVSSFGAESAVLLHLVARVDPTVPIILLDTGKLFPETLAYADHLTDRLGLADVRRVTPEPAAVAAQDASGLRWSFDPDGCCAIRKSAPLERALTGFELSLSGRKRFQASTRAALSLFEPDGRRLKLNPLAGWSRAMLLSYMETHALPPHPLVASGFASIGCSPCTSPVRPDEDPRAGRWRGWEKTECGIHLPNGAGDPAF
jgi:phosphoadenosine phosphosulfate reductase